MLQRSLIHCFLNRGIRVSMNCFEQKNQKSGYGGETMFNKVAVLEVMYKTQRVGRLALASDQRCVFEYDAQWINNGFSISPFYLPLKRGVFSAKNDPFNGLFGVFNDSLPDGWSQLLIDRWFTICKSSFTIVRLYRTHESYHRTYQRYH